MSGEGADAADRIERAIAYVDERARERPGLAELARVACMSPYHFHRTFSRAVGESVRRYVAARALARAAWTLANRPALSVTETAMEFGFSSPSDFSRAFKSAYGMSPTEFRSAGAAALAFRAGIAGGGGVAAPPPQARVVRLPDLRLAYIRVFGLSADRRSARVEGAFERLHGLMRRSGAAVEGGLVLGLTMDHPETLPLDRCRYYACIEAAEGAEPAGEARIARFRTAGEYARAEVPEGPSSPASRFFGTCSFLVGSWMPERSLKPDDRPFLEVFAESGAPRWSLLVPIAGTARFV
jgi:AraC family transcriptional regulator